MPFKDYIAACRLLIGNRRVDLNDSRAETIITANSPFELHSNNSETDRTQSTYGALLIHGLYECPFSQREIANDLHKQNILCKSILLPGHGTVPADLLHISFMDWVQTVEYGVAQLKQQAQQIFLIGYSTGATLALYHALHDADIAGVILLAPAIKLKASVNTYVACQQLAKAFSASKEWISVFPETNYVKYSSVPFNSVKQINKLMHALKNRHKTHVLSCPIDMILTHEDETICSKAALDYFKQYATHPKSKCLIYQHQVDCEDRDSRIITRNSFFKDLQIEHLSHLAMPFSPLNDYYGPNGELAKQNKTITNKHTLFGAYNPIEVGLSNLFYRLKLIQHKRKALLYNPDFAYMSNQIIQFICANEKLHL